MPKFYCKVVVDGRPIWGYRNAKTDELALACFLQDHGLSEEHAKRGFADTVDLLKMARLLEFIPEDLDPWGCDTPFTLQDVEEVDEDHIEDLRAYESHDLATSRVTDRFWHAARILWLIKNPESLEDPISVDNHCHYGNVYPLPEIMDGWHRFFAHRFLGNETIPALYSGRVDLLRYLQGKTDKLPE